MKDAPLRPATTRQAIRQRARELGFDDCRFTTAAPPESTGKFQEWLVAGNHAGMAWLERNAEKRVEPQNVLAGARSVICLAVSYAADNPQSECSLSLTPALSRWEREKRSLSSGESTAAFSSTGNEFYQRDQNLSPLPAGEGQGEGERSLISTGIVARYARFDDYHDVLAGKLKALTDFVNQLAPETRSLWYVDTGPVLERDFAQRAGLGFVGKHTNLISRRLGNWIFLAEILTTLELEPDTPEQNHCGNCTRCLTACPTQAITAPFTLDARKCISYLTIELKGSIPVELRPLIGNRIYGCDDCLAACPWNRFAREGSLMKSHARPDLQTPDLPELLSLDDVQFKARFAGSPILRTKRRGLLRNVCVALGNVGGTSALPVLEKAAADKEPLIAEHARWAMDRIRGRSGVQ
jgi:epoxyqueuosine reductase